MKHVLMLFLLTLVIPVFSQKNAELIPNTAITDVTVFLQSAQVTRKAEVIVPKGETIINIKGLSLKLDPKSILIKMSGDVIVKSINHKLNFIENTSNSMSLSKFNSQIDSLEKLLIAKETRIQILNEKKDLLDKNKLLKSETDNLSLQNLHDAMKFFEERLTEIHKEENLLQNEIKSLKEIKLKIENQIKEFDGKDREPSGEIAILVESDGLETSSLVISYLVSNAGWYPNYDIRARNVNEPIALTYKADVYQNTGEDWNNVHVRLSNVTPTNNGVAPNLKKWELNYPRNTVYSSKSPSSPITSLTGRIVDQFGEPLIGANIIVKGTNIGTLSDVQGNFSITLPQDKQVVEVTYIGFSTKAQLVTSSFMVIALEESQELLEEVVVAGYGGLEGRVAGVSTRQKREEKAKAPIVTLFENQTSLDFDIIKPYTIPSINEKVSIQINEHQLDAEYQYVVCPKIEPSAYLLAKIVNWEQYNLLEGEANLFFEDTYVGRTILEARSLSDTLTISLGKDRGIFVERKKIEDFSSDRLLAKNKSDLRKFSIVLKNQKNAEVNLLVFDQIPVATIKDINVSPRDLSNGKLNEETGIIEWDINLKPNEVKEIFLEYEVKYPKNEKLSLE